MTAATSEIDLQKFCKGPDEPSRWDFTKPWVWDGWKYATNGSICIRIRTDEPNHEKPPAPAQDLFRFNSAHCVEPWDGKIIRAVANCPVCNGKGKTPCSECGQPAHFCHECGGECRFEQDVACQAGGAFMKPALGRLIGRLPNVRYRPLQNREKAQQMCFAFDGGEGLVMCFPKLQDLESR